MTDLYTVRWPILDDEMTVRDLKAEAERDLVTMLHDEGLIPVTKPALRVAPGGGELLGAVRVIKRPWYGQVSA